MLSPRKYGRYLQASGFFALTTLVAIFSLSCGGLVSGNQQPPPVPSPQPSPGPVPPTPINVTVSPASLTGIAGQVVWFVANVTGTSNTAVNWSVNGMAGGNSTVGSISNAGKYVGKYTAPTTVPSPATVTVTATSQADTTKSASAAINIVAAVVGSVNVQVTGTTATQAVMTYTAPNTNPCALQVQENSSSSPVVHDVDPVLFPGSNTDAGGGVNRLWVVGKRTVQLGADGNNYSRALQNNTLHYFQITCGSNQSQGFFTTTNIPLGKTFAEPQIMNGTQYVFPSLPQTRGYEIVDPITGALTRRLTLSNDAGSLYTQEWFTGSWPVCAQQLSNGGWHCAIMVKNGNMNLYWINPTDGSSRFLGQGNYPAGTDYQTNTLSVSTAELFDSSNPNVYYAMDHSNQIPAQPVVIQCTYTGGDVAVSPGANAPLSCKNLTPVATGTLPALANKFDSNFNWSQLDGCGLYLIQSHYLVGDCNTFSQDSAAWVFAFDLNTSNVVALEPMWSRPISRWCGLHLIEQTDADILTKFHGMHGSGTGGPYNVALTGAVGTSDTSFSVSGEPTTANPPPSGQTRLMPDATGDVFQFDDGTGEIVKISNKVSSTSWAVNRGYWGTSVTSHALNATMEAVCNDSSGGSSQPQAATGLIWDYLHDPHGTDTTGAYYYVDSPGFPGVGHMAIGAPNGSSTAYEVNEGWSIRDGHSEPQIFQQPWTFALDSSPPFAGTVMGAWDNSYQPHPSYDSTQAPASELWFLDVPFLTGGMYKDTATLLSGTLYQYNLAGSPGATASLVHQFNPNLPYFGVNNANWLLDISGPGSVITGNATNNYKMCVVKNAGECVSGSTPGNIYFNVPNLTDLFCRSGEAAPNVDDICIQNYPTYGEAVDQLGFTPANLESSGSGGSLPLYGAGNSRVIVSGTMLGPYRQLNGFSNAHALPDGSWAIFGTQIGTAASTGSDLLLVKLPPTPADDGIDRTNFENVQVKIGNPGGSATHARIKYGYEENGTRSSFFCTQRAEACYSTDQNLPLNSTQTLLVGVPQRVLFYQVEYLDSSLNVVASDPVAAAAIP